jgi:REP element-mobilizing transposase RayT
MQEHFHRRNLPHLYFSDGFYFITYRLNNSLPVDKIKQMLSNGFEKWEFEKFFRLFEKYDKLLNSNEFNINYLLQDEIADICSQTLHYPDGTEYRLICYCIMPNHIHLVFELLPGNKGISKIMQSIKRISARKCNLELNLTGNFWQDESYDRWIRDEKELYYVIRYVLLNPVTAGFEDNWQDWKNTYCNSNYIIL